jgi:hypothetical protein
MMGGRTVALREDQIRRYARHVLLPDVGGRGQERLLRARVRVELGPERAAEAAALAYLAAAGVGTLVLVGDVDGPLGDDEVARGILYGASDRGRPRGEAARARIAALNPDVSIEVMGEVMGEVGGAGALGLSEELEADAAGPETAPEADPGLAVADALARGGAAACRLLVRIARQRTS